MPTLNVRLSRADAELARRLRSRGQSVSEVVRAAIRAEASRGSRAMEIDARALIAEMELRFPTTSGMKARRIDAADRRQARRRILGKLRRAR